MALVFPQCTSYISHFTYSNNGNNVLVRGGQMRVGYLKKKGNNIIRCDTDATHTDATSAVSEVVPHARVTGFPFVDPKIHRSDFPNDFKFGASTCALQSEGPANIGGRGPGNWDSIITQGSSYGSASLSYLKYEDDVELLKQMGMNTYRFSISWSRILPNGKGVVNQEGIEFYNKLIDKLEENGIEPLVTLLHFDVPEALQKEYKGFLDGKIVEDFKNYCDICFKNFGSRVKFWVTINEPDVFAEYGYYQGNPPLEEDKARHPYIVVHNIISAHAAVYRHYKENYKATQGGEIGLPVSLVWLEPYSESIADKEAADRGIAFRLGWFLEPLVYGDYPFIMKALVRDRLPEFTQLEKETIKGAYDFIGVNYYKSKYAKAMPISHNDVPVSYERDQYFDRKDDKDGIPIGENIVDDIYMMPDGLKQGLIYIKEHYLNPRVYITENGVDDREKGVSVTDDDHRIKFISHHLKAVLDAWKEEQVNVKGYMVWSLMDVVEMGGGYNVRLGLNYTDYNNYSRTPKNSANWFSKFMKNKDSLVLKQNIN